MQLIRKYTAGARPSPGAVHIDLRLHLLHLVLAIPPVLLIESAHVLPSHDHPWLVESETAGEQQFEVVVHLLRRAFNACISTCRFKCCHVLSDTCGQDLAAAEWHLLMALPLMGYVSAAATQRG